MRRGEWETCSSRQRSSSRSGGGVSSVYVTITPEADGCSALLLLIGAP